MEIQHSFCKSETESWLCKFIPPGLETPCLSTSVSSGFTLLIRVEFNKYPGLKTGLSNVKSNLGNRGKVEQQKCGSHLVRGEQGRREGQRMSSVLYEKKNMLFFCQTETVRVYGGCGSFLLSLLFGSLWQSLWDTVRMSTTKHHLYFLVFNH